MKRVPIPLSCKVLLSALCLLVCASRANRADIDVNGDGSPDLLFQSQTSGKLVYWLLHGATYGGGGSLQSPVSADWKVVDTADFNGDGKPDLLFQNATTNQVLIWYLNGPTVIGGGLVSQTPAAGYKVVAVGDFNGDGHIDLVFQNQATNLVLFWYLNGTTVIGGGAASIVPGTGYKVIGAGDFNGDGKPDLVFQNSNTHQIAFWYLNGTTVTGGATLAQTPPAAYPLVGLGDFNGDGKPDLLFQNASTGQLVGWLLNGVTYTGGVSLPSPATADWKVAGLRSFLLRPVVIRLETLGLSALYGNVRVRVKNLTNPNATVAVRIGSRTSPSAHLAYTDANAPGGTSALGGAIDFLVPYNLASGSQNLIVTVNGKDLPAYHVTISDTDPFAVFTLGNGGTFVAELRPDAAPNTVSNFVGLATGAETWLDPCTGQMSNAPLYDGTTFHRVIDGFVEQGGDPLSKCKPAGDPSIGTGTPGYYIPFEVNSLTNVDGALAMAHGTDLNSAGCQFFIDNGPQHHLDTLIDSQGHPTYGYEVFGLVVEGLAVTKQITKTYDPKTQLPIPGAVPDRLAHVIISGKIDTP